MLRRILRVVGRILSLPLRYPFWTFWVVCMALATGLIAIGLSAWSWVPLLLLYAGWTIYAMLDHRQSMRAADELLDSIRALQNKQRKLGDRMARGFARRGALLAVKEEQVDKLMMGIASGQGTVERMKITLSKEGEDA